MELDGIVNDMEATTVGVVPGMRIMVALEDEVVDGEEADAEGEEDWSQAGVHDTTMNASQFQQQEQHESQQYVDETDSERDAGLQNTVIDHETANLNEPTGVVDSQPADPAAPAPSAPSDEEVATTSSEDGEFEDITSSEEEEDDDDDDDDDEFVLNPRQRRRRSTSAADNRRRRRGLGGTYVPANAASASGSPLPSFAAGTSASELGLIPYSMTEGRSLRSRSASTRYNPYQYSDCYSPSGAVNHPSYSSGGSTPLQTKDEDTTSSRRRSRPSPSLGVPVPVPNLTKKSRGRRVPTMSSLEDLRSAASGAGKKRQGAGGRSARMYLCDVEGCGKCFARGEHLKRHVRSIHTYEKRTFSLLILHPEYDRVDALPCSSQVPLSRMREGFQPTR